MWDIYRCQGPLLSLLWPSTKMGDICQSIVLMGQQLGGNGFPNWPLVDHHTCTMDGQSAANIISDAYLWGVRNFDVKSAYQLMKSDATSPKSPCARSHQDLYDTLGFIPLEADPKGNCLYVIVVLFVCYFLTVIHSAL